MKELPVLSIEARNLEPGLYQHYKGNFYQVLGVARHSETLEEVAVYQALYGQYSWWVRPVKMFYENVDLKGQSVPRFKFIKKLNN